MYDPKIGESDENPLGDLLQKPQLLNEMLVWDGLYLKIPLYNDYSIKAEVGQTYFPHGIQPTTYDRLLRRSLSCCSIFFISISWSRSKPVCIILSCLFNNVTVLLLSRLVSSICSFSCHETS